MTTVRSCIADALARERTQHVFALMGDGNMAVCQHLSDDHGIPLTHARHEAAAVLMADGYARATGNVGVATVTNGPGLTHTATSLVVAARRGTPLVLLVGDTPPTKHGYNQQQFEQAPFVRSTGAAFFPVQRASQVPDIVHEAFSHSRINGQPVVLSVPMDIQEMDVPAPSRHIPTSAEILPSRQRPHADPAVIRSVAERLTRAERPVVLAGAGAVASQASSAIIRLADRVGALLATTLPGKGLFVGHPWNIGMAGGFAPEVTRELLRESDLILAIGASVSYYTRDGDNPLFDPAHVIQIDVRPTGTTEGLVAACAHIVGDAAAVCLQLNESLASDGFTQTGYRRPEVAGLLPAEPVKEERDFGSYEGSVDTRTAMRLIDRHIPSDSIVVVGVGHFMSFAEMYMDQRDQAHQIHAYEFGAIGHALSMGVGAARSRSHQHVTVIEGDGGVYQNVQELDTIARHGLNVLVCVVNDGAYGAEVHKLNAAGYDGEAAYFGYGAFGDIARAMGLPGFLADSEESLERALCEAMGESSAGSVIDVRVSRHVLSPKQQRRQGLLAG